jgi:hypothetical protein
MTERGLLWTKWRCAGRIETLPFLGVAFAALLVGAALGGGCGGQAGTTATDTNTNWLRACDKDADCGSALSCLCGVCTVTCESTSECRSVGGRGVCNTSSSCDEAPAVCEKEDAGVSGGKEKAPVAPGETGGTGSDGTADFPAGAGGRSATEMAAGAAGLPERTSPVAGGAPTDSRPSTGGSTGGSNTGGVDAGGYPGAASGGSEPRIPKEDYEAASAARPSGMGPCADGRIDFECDSILEPCPSGMHRDFDVSDPCAICVADSATPPSCDEARARYTALLEHVIPSSCSDYCETDSECFIHTLDNSCGSGCEYALYGGIDEEIIEVASQFAAETCTPACGRAPGPECETGSGGGMEAVCVSNRCTLRAIPD